MSKLGKKVVRGAKRKRMLQVSICVYSVLPRDVALVQKMFKSKAKKIQKMRWSTPQTWLDYEITTPG